MKQIKWYGYTLTRDKYKVRKHICAVDTIEKCVHEMTAELSCMADNRDYYIKCIYSFNGLDDDMDIIKLKYDAAHKKWFAVVK